MQPDRSSMVHPGYTLRDVLVLTACIGVLLAISVPAISRWREADRRNQCANNVRLLGLGILNYEQAHGYFPGASDAAGLVHEVPPGSFGEQSSGYSWIAKVLKMTIDAPIDIKTVSQDYTLRPFDPTTVNPRDGNHFATYDPVFRCPDFTGGATVATDLPSEYDKLSLAGGRPVISNYAALIGADIAAGGVISGGVRLTKMADVLDGAASTFVICESRETMYTAWIDGQATWIIGLKGKRGSSPLTHLIGVGPTGRMGKAYSEVVTSFWPTNRPSGWPGVSPRRWGPSSQHAKGVVQHGFLDNHVQFISPDINPRVYNSLIIIADEKGSCTI